MNNTPTKFARTNRTDPQRSPDVFSGPFTRQRFFVLHRWVAGTMLFASIAATLLVLSGAFK